MRSEMESLIKAVNNEPIGHELFLEAWELRKSNPRSALIIGMSAAEVGFKQCIGKLVRDAEWLATNAPIYLTDQDRGGLCLRTHLDG